MNKPPPKLFKYRSMDGEAREQTLAIIKNSQLWFSAATTFNDPFDSQPLISIHSTIAERADYARRLAAAQLPGNEMGQKRLFELVMASPDEEFFRRAKEAARGTASWLGVCSLSANPGHVLMWSHYAANHKGICLEFDTSEVPLGLAHRVRYSAERPVVVPMTADSEVIMTALITKAEAWAYEEEWRVVEGDALGLQSFPEEALTAVILGARISEEDAAGVMEAVAGRAVQPEVWQARLEEDGFGLLFDLVSSA